MSLFFAYEIATSSSDFRGVFETEAARDTELTNVAVLFDLAETEYATGSVEAASPEAALEAVRLGHWSYSHRL